jgi:uncharacterized membrane protein HdeD (DUF308 family)
MGKKLNEFGGILVAILEVILGIVILLKPMEFTNIILNCFGIVLVIMGIISCINYFTTPKELAIFEHNLTKGIILCIFGVVLIYSKELLISSISIIYGIIILIGSIRKIQFTVDFLRIGEKFWIASLIEAIISIILALIIIKDPFIAVNAMWIFIGVSIIIEGVFNAISSAYWYSIKKNFEN